MEVFLAAVAAILFGSSDLFAARAGRHAPTLAVTRTAVVVSVFVSGAAALIQWSTVTWRDLVVGSASGVAMIGGLAVLYFGYAATRIGLVAPVSAVVTAMIPILFGAVNGDTLTSVVVVGVVLGLVALMLTSVQRSGLGWSRQSFLLGVGAGSLLGIALSLMGTVSSAAGLSAVAAQRIAGLALLTVLWKLRPDPYLAPAGLARRQAVATGLLASAAVIALQVAFQSGNLGSVAVIGSQFTTVAVVLAVVVDREPIRWWQVIGVACTAVAVALLAIG